MSSKKTKLDERIAQWRVKLKKKYKNEGDDRFTYIGPNGALSLSNAMLRDWSVALVSFQNVDMHTLITNLLG